MDIYDEIVRELFANKSFSALIYLIDKGRELEFKYDNKVGFISRDKARRYVSLWIDKEEQSFDSIEELIENAHVQNLIFGEIWKDIKLQTLF